MSTHDAGRGTRAVPVGLTTTGSLRRPVAQVALMAVAFWGWTSTLQPDQPTSLSATALIAGATDQAAARGRAAGGAPNAASGTADDRFAGGVNTVEPRARSAGSAPIVPGTLPIATRDATVTVPGSAALPGPQPGGGVLTERQRDDQGRLADPRTTSPLATADPIPTADSNVAQDELRAPKTVDLPVTSGPDGEQLEQVYAVVWVTPAGASVATPTLVPLGAPRPVQPTPSTDDTAADDKKTDDKKPDAPKADDSSTADGTRTSDSNGKTRTSDSNGKGDGVGSKSKDGGGSTRSSTPDDTTRDVDNVTPTAVPPKESQDAGTPADNGTPTEGSSTPLTTPAAEGRPEGPGSSDAPTTEPPPVASPPVASPPVAPPTDAPPTDAPPTDAPPTDAPPTDAPPSDAPPADTATPSDPGSSSPPGSDDLPEGTSLQGALFFLMRRLLPILP